MRVSWDVISPYSLSNQSHVRTGTLGVSWIGARPHCGPVQGLGTRSGSAYSRAEYSREGIPVVRLVRLCTPKITSDTMRRDTTSPCCNQSPQLACARAFSTAASRNGKPTRINLVARRPMDTSPRRLRRANSPNPGFGGQQETSPPRYDGSIPRQYFCVKNPAFAACRATVMVPFGIVARTQSVRDKLVADFRRGRLGSDRPDLSSGPSRCAKDSMSTMRTPWDQLERRFATPWLQSSRSVGVYVGNPPHVAIDTHSILMFAVG